MMTTRHPLTTAWLERLERLAGDLPPQTRSELLSDIEEHLDEAVASDATGADVGVVLDRLGDPADIVAAARHDDATTRPTTDDRGVRVDRTLPTEVLAIAALALSGIVAVVWPLAIVLWIGGFVMAAVRGRWSAGELAALGLVPIGFALPGIGLIGTLVFATEQCVESSAGAGACDAGANGGAAILVVVGVILLLVGLVMLIRYLARAPRGRPITW